MNDTQFMLFLQDSDKLKEYFNSKINDLYEEARELYVTYDVLVHNCNTLVEELRESRAIAHKLREQLKKYEPETTL